MLTQSPRTPSRLIGLALAALVTTGVIGFAVRNSMGSATVDSGELEIDGTAYLFTPSTCTITDGGFLTAGSGEVDGEEFWISISPDGAELALGTSDEMSRSDDDNDLWLTSVGEVSWEPVDETTVEADVTMGNARVAESPMLQGHAVVTCDAR